MAAFRIGLDPYDLEAFLPLAASFGTDRYGYVVTPNADHVVRLDRTPALRPLYDEATFSLLDSRFIAKLVRRFRGRELPVCVGSDLTAALFERVVRPDDRLVVVGSTPEQIAELRARFGLRALVHHDPPMGFIRDPRAVETCLAFVEAQSPFRYCFLAVGSPQQEQVAHRLMVRGEARGLALCIGASINFLTGGERRAPAFMQRLGIEWLYRLLQDPRRMWRRYVLRAPRAVGIALTGDFELRAPRS